MIGRAHLQAGKTSAPINVTVETRLSTLAKSRCISLDSKTGFRFVVNVFPNLTATGVYLSWARRTRDGRIELTPNSVSAGIAA
jgi:hypothetical protein